MPDDADDSEREVTEAGDDRTPMLMTALKLARELLPGDSRYGDPLSSSPSADRASSRRPGSVPSR
jgi:hypothetical protein